MVRITKIYTRTGDKGMTSLAGKHRVAKTGVRMEAIGCVDELNACLGFVVADIENNSLFVDLTHKITRIQNELFNLGSQLAVLTKDRRDNTPTIKQYNTAQLEQEIDVMNKDLPSLRSFVLPGGGEISARLHLARTVCRRAERDLLRLGESEALDGVEVPYLNRLSDWLFVATRFVAAKTNTKELLWIPNKEGD